MTQTKKETPSTAKKPAKAAQTPPKPSSRRRKSAYERPNAEKIAIGTRVRRAREIANMTLTEAAERLGYAQPVQLSQMENGKRRPNLEMVVRFTQLYCTSADYLLGLTDDVDADPAASMMRLIVAESGAFLTAIAKGYTELNTKVARQLMPDTAEGQRLAAAAIDCMAALSRFADRNQKFQDMPGGATVMMKAEVSADLAKRYLDRVERTRRLLNERFKRDLAAVLPSDGPQLSLLPVLEAIN